MIKKIANSKIIIIFTLYFNNERYENTTSDLFDRLFSYFLQQIVKKKKIQS